MERLVSKALLVVLLGSLNARKLHDNSLQVEEA